MKLDDQIAEILANAPDLPAKEHDYTDDDLAHDGVGYLLELIAGVERLCLDGYALGDAQEVIASAETLRQLAGGEAPDYTDDDVAVTALYRRAYAVSMFCQRRLQRARFRTLVGRHYGLTANQRDGLPTCCAFHMVKAARQLMEASA